MVRAAFPRKCHGPLLTLFFRRIHTKKTERIAPLIYIKCIDTNTPADDEAPNRPLNKKIRRKANKIQKEHINRNE